MKEAWIIGALAAVFASIPQSLRNRLEPKEGGIQSRNTQILPVVLGEEQYVLISYYELSGPAYGKMPKIYPPFASAQISYPDKLATWREVKPETYGLTNLLVTDHGTLYLGLLEKGPSASVQEWRSAEKRYNLLISKVLEQRWLLTHHIVTQEERTTARELQECIQILYEKPLLPYYHHAGSNFFAWMERTSK